MKKKEEMNKTQKEQNFAFVIHAEKRDRRKESSYKEYIERTKAIIILESQQREQMRQCTLRKNFLLKQREDEYAHLVTCKCIASIPRRMSTVPRAGE